jgi:hypothetical protein
MVLEYALPNLGQKLYIELPSPTPSFPVTKKRGSKVCMLEQERHKERVGERREHQTLDRTG